MTPAEFREARHTLGLSLAEMGRVVGRTGRAIAMYEAGDRAVPRDLDALVRLLLTPTKRTRDTILAEGR